MILTVIVTAAAAVRIYRLGVCDGQTMARGERVKMPSVKHKNDNDEREKMQRGIKNILDYGINGGAGK